MSDVILPIINNNEFTWEQYDDLTPSPPVTYHDLPSEKVNHRHDQDQSCDGHQPGYRVM